MKERFLSSFFDSSDLVKVSDDLVQEPQAFQALLVDIALGVKFFEIRHRGEHHTHAVIGLVVEVLSGKKKQTKKIQKAQSSVYPRGDWDC